MVININEGVDIMRLKLNGIWNFKTKNEEIEAKVPGNIPITPDSFPNPVFLNGVYQRVLSELKNKKGKKAIIIFHAVDYEAEIYINKKIVGSHKGGFDKFHFEITNYLRFDGSDLLEVKVSDFDIRKYPERVIGKQDWYGNNFGIWQDVELWVVDPIYIENVFIYPQNDLKNIQVKPIFSDRETHEIEVIIKNKKGDIIVCKKENSNSFFIEIPKPILWSPDNPYLYSIELKYRDLKNQDIYITKFGLRSINIKEDKIFLNGKLLYIFGALDQNFYPDSHYSLPKKNKLIRELSKAKDMGLNLLRCHVKIPDDDYLEVADELGILVWIDLPYARQLNNESKKYLKKLFHNLIERHFNHPSFVILSLINESWGLNLSDKPSQDDMAWLTNFYKLAKKKDPSRIVVDNSPCVGNYHVTSDLDDYHFYKSFPYHRDEWDNLISDFSKNTFKTFLGDKNKLPKLVSEFGLWGLSDFRTWEGFWHKSPIFIVKKFPNTEPQNAIERISKFTNPDSFIQQANFSEFLGLKYEIERMRMQQEISGYVITEFSDIGWEGNGLLDFNRDFKWFSKYMKYINNQLLPIIPNHRSLILENKYCNELFISNKYNEDKDIIILIKIGDTKEVINTTIASNTISRVKKINLGRVEGASEISIEIFNKAGEIIGKNFYPIQFLKDLKQKKEEDKNINWIETSRSYIQDVDIIKRNEKIFENITFEDDWMHSFTLFYMDRNINPWALLWDLPYIQGDFIIIPKDLSNFKRTRNSVIDRIFSWGYVYGSLCFYEYSDSKKQIYTTLKRSKITEILMNTI